MAIRWQLRRVAAAVAAVAGAAALAGCQADDGPIEVTEGTISQDVHVTTSARVADDGIWWDYVLENDSGEDVWIVEPTAAFAVRDRSVPDGVALVAAMTPVRDDVDYAQAPSSALVRLAPGATLDGSGRAARPFEAFADRPGDEPVPLPADPATVRVCAGYVLASEVAGVLQRPADDDGDDGDDGTARLDHADGFPLQRLACSAPLDLG